MQNVRLYLSVLVVAVLLSGCTLIDSAVSDQAALDSLREAGSDMTKTHPFDFYIYHPDVSGAEQICTQLRDDGFKVTVMEGAVEDEWLCLASMSFVPSINKLTELQAEFDQLTSLYGGEYDGWETILIPE